MSARECLTGKNLIVHPFGDALTVVHYPVRTLEYSAVYVYTCHPLSAELCKQLTFPLFCFGYDWAILWFRTVPKTNGCICSFATCLFPTLFWSQASSIHTSKQNTFAECVCWLWVRIVVWYLQLSEQQLPNSIPTSAHSHYDTYSRKMQSQRSTAQFIKECFQ
jgi:hypothetical protein